MILEPIGDVDFHVADQLRIAGLAAIVAGAPEIAVDLSRVTFIDSSGLAALITINNELRPSDRKLVLLAPARPVSRILEITGLVPAFTVE